ncbi:MAG: hypothetical protein Q8O89_04195 [Nanoarchaeota archaeon]|nr:hypothetical protein [Nanoarchaeota archaeon]
MKKKEKMDFFEKKFLEDELAKMDDVEYRVAKGEIFVPGEVSLHVADYAFLSGSQRSNCGYYNDAQCVPIERGIVEYNNGGPVNAKGKIVFPPFSSWLEQPKELYSTMSDRANYIIVANKLQEAGVLSGSPSFPELEINEKSKLRFIREGVYSPHNGAVYFNFDSPAFEGQVGRISIHRDFEKTLELYRMILGKE